MDEKIKEAIDKSLKELESIQAKVEKFVDDLPEDTYNIKSTAKKTLAQVYTLLNKATDQAGKQTEEAHLQAHLGVKEAEEKLKASKDVVDDYLARTGENTKRLFDEVQLKQKLAMMEARDFWEERGSKMADEFKESTANLQSVTEKAVGDLHEAFAQFNDIFQKAGKGK